MSFVTDTWHQLVRRRLWPVALLLLIALVAVPVVLAKDSEIASTAPVPPAANADTTLTADAAPIVAPATAEEARRRHVLGSAKNPFEPAPAKKVKKAKTQAGAGTGTEVAVTDPATTPGGPSGGATAPADPGPVVPTPLPEPEAPDYPLYTLTVGFGDSTSDSLSRRKVTRLEALPSAEEPALVYLGVKNGGKAAVFILDSSVTPQGDGQCDPTPESCETLTMREGDTEFFDVLDEAGNPTAQYQLDLVDIKTRRTASAGQARRAYARHSKAGAKAVRARASLGGPHRYRYNARKGTVHHLGIKAWRAMTARAASLRADF